MTNEKLINAAQRYLDKKKKETEEKSSTRTGVLGSFAQKYFEKNRDSLVSGFENDVKNYQNAVSGLYNDWNSRFYDENGTYRNTYRGDTEDWLKSYGERSSAAEGAKKRMTDFLDAYENMLNKDSVTKVRSYLRDTSSGLSSMRKTAETDRDYWSKWATEDEYKKAISDAEKSAADYERAKTVDLEELDEQIRNAANFDYNRQSQKLGFYKEALDYFKTNSVGDGRIPNWGLKAKEYDPDNSARQEVQKEIYGYLNPEEGFSGSDAVYSGEKMTWDEFKARRNSGMDVSVNDVYITGNFPSLVASGLSEAEYARLKGENRTAPVTEESRDALKYLEGKIGEIEGYESAADLRLLKRQAQYLQTNAKYTLMPDFAELSQREISGGGRRRSGDDPLGAFFEATEQEKTDALREYQAGLTLSDKKAESRKNAIARGVTGYYDNLTDEDRAVYYYILHTEGTEKAEKYLKSLETILGMREQEKERERLKDASGWELAGYNLGSLFLKFANAEGLAEDIESMFIGTEVNPYSYAHRYTNLADNIRSETSSRIDNDVLNFIYNNGMSIADNVIRLPMGHLGLPLMATQVFESSVKRGYERGLSNGQIMQTALAESINEVLFEKMSLDRLLKAKDLKSVKEVFIDALKQGGVEASEEAFTSIANNFADAWINGGDSEYNANVRKLLAENPGMSVNDARSKALGGVVKDIALDAAGGLLSGGLMGSVGGAKNYVNTIKSNVDPYLTGDKLDEGKVDALKEYAGAIYENPGALSGKVSSEAMSELSKALGDLGNKTSKGNVARLNIAYNNVLTSAYESSLNAALESSSFAGTFGNEEVREIASAVTEGASFDSIAEQYADRLGSRSEEFAGLLKSADNEINTAFGNAFNAYRESHKESAQDAEAAESVGAEDLTENGEVERASSPENVAAPVESKSSAIDEDVDYSANGKTLLKTRRGVEDAKIVDIVSNENGKMTVKIEAGGETQTVPLSSVSLGSESMAVLYSQMQRLGVSPNTAKTLIEAYNDPVGTEADKFSAAVDYVNDVRLSYRAGMIGNEAALASVRTLTPQQARSAYNLGREDSGRHVDNTRNTGTSSQQNVRQNKKAKNKKVRYRDAIDPRVTKLNAQQKAGVAAAELLNELSSLDITVFASHVIKNSEGKNVRVFKNERGQIVEAPNGFFMNGNEIWIDVNAGDLGQGAMLFTLSHEVSHFIRDFSPSKWRKMADWIVENFVSDEASVDELLQQEINKRRAEHRARHEAMPTEAELINEAYEELIADGLSSVLTKQAAYDQLVSKLREVNESDPTFANKLKTFIRDLISKLKRFLSSYSDDGIESAAGRAVANFPQEVYDKLVELYTDAFAEAERNYRENGGEGASETKRSGRNTRDYSEYDKPITSQDVFELRSIGRKSVNSFTSEDVEKSQKWAYKFYRELGTKSPFFRAWYGDWRANESKLVSVLQINGRDEFTSGKEINNDTGRIISWNKDTAKESVLNASSTDKTDMRLIAGKLNEFVKSAILFDTVISEPDSKRKLPGTAFMHSFYSIASVNDNNVLIKMYAEEAFSEKQNTTFTRSYSLKAVEKIADFDNGVLRSKTGLTGSQSATTISISDLYELVKTFDKDFTPGKTVNPVLLNEDGTPKIFYHGSRKGGGFTVFKNWQYFTESKQYAERYTERDNPDSLYPVYLRMEKPFDTRDPKCAAIFEQMKSEYGLSDLQENGLPDWTDGGDIADFIEENGLDYDGIILDEGGDLVDGKPVSRGLSYVVRNPEQIKSATDNIGTFDGTNPDIRYSRRNSEYMSAVESGDVETQKRLVAEAAEEAMSESAIRKSNGELRQVYHGTYSDGFTVFDKSLIGTARAGDVGFFGKGFYFAYSEGEARMYGKNIIKAYLDIRKPFNFEKELNTFKGERSYDYIGGRAVFAVNFADKFPELADKHFVTVWDRETGDTKELSLKEFSEIFKNIYENKDFKVEKIKTAYGEEWLISADPVAESYTDSDGNVHQWTDSKFQQRCLDEVTANNKITQVVCYLQNRLYDGIKLPSSVDIVQETDITEALKKRKYDGAIQSEEGDEVVAFYENQIKSADPITYDDEGNVIPLDERFNSKERDIRYSSRNRTVSEAFEKETLDKYGITRINDSVHVQKAVVGTLGRTFFYDENGNKCAYTNAESGMVIEIDRKGINETFNEQNYTRMSRDTKVLKIATVEQIPQAIENGTVEYDDVKNYHNASNPNKQYAYISWKTNVDGIPITIKLDIKKSFEKNKFWVHRVIIENAVGTSGITQVNDGPDYLTYGNDEYITSEPESQDKKSSTRNLTREENDARVVAKDLKKTFGLRMSSDEIAVEIADAYRQIEKEMGSARPSVDRIEGLINQAAENINELRLSQNGRTEEAQEVLDALRGSRIYIDDETLGEIEHAYGKYGTFTKKFFGSGVTFTRNAGAGTSLDTYWQEWSEAFPHVFDSETNSGDMASRLLETVETLKDSYEENGVNAEDLTRQIAEAVSNGYFEYHSARTGGRAQLIDAIESTANPGEKQVLGVYRDRLAEIERAEKRLNEVNGELKKLSFAKGPRDADRINELRREKAKLTNALDIYDKQLLRFESTSVLKKAFDRERARLQKEGKLRTQNAVAVERVRQDIALRQTVQHYRDARKKAVEGRRQTEMRHRIIRVVNELDNLILHPTKTSYVPTALQGVVAEALEMVNTEFEAKVEAALDRAEHGLTSQARAESMMQRLINLKAAYEDIKKDSDSYGIYDENVASLIDKVEEKVGDTPLSRMTSQQLEYVLDMYTAIKTTVSRANKTFKAERTATISELSDAVMREVKATGKDATVTGAAAQAIKDYGYDILKPETFIKYLRSDTMSDVFSELMDGEGKYARNLEAAEKFVKETGKKYGYGEWDLDKKFRFTSSSGQNFEISLNNILSLYAYSKREQAAKHLAVGGFITGVTKEKGKIRNDTTSYQVNADDLRMITDTLTPAQREYVDEMTRYLSEDMAKLGNEITMEMYGIKRFKEKHYFPLSVSSFYLNYSPENTGAVKQLKNAGFTKELTPNARNPVVLDSFLDVWAKHVNQMSMYNAFTLALEDFMRVYNYESVNELGSSSVKATIEQVFSSGASNYIKKLISDLNGAAQGESSSLEKLVGKFKKGAVFANLSVIIQQPTSFPRAFVYIPARYFATVPNISNKAWEECKKWCDIAVIKEMGSFDIGTGRVGVDLLTGSEYEGFGNKLKAFFTDSGYRDDVLSKGAEAADRITWTYMWQAVKNMVSHTTDLEKGSDAFFKKASEIFTEAMRKTQVYDSTLSRCGMMRSTNGLAKMATAFMAEPITTVNMAVEATLEGKKGNHKFVRATIAGLLASTLLNDALKALVAGLRDKDEDETYLEKWLEHFSSDFIADLNPVNYMPILKDIWSLALGYSVDRTDMSVISDLLTSGGKVIKAIRDGKDPLDPGITFLGDISKASGLAINNILRDGKAIVGTIQRAVNNAENGVSTTPEGVKKAILTGIYDNIPLSVRPKADDKSEMLYSALMSGDAERVNRVKAGYSSDSAYSTAVRKALRDHDSRIRQAAVALIDGDYNERVRITREIESEKHFSLDDVIRAINTESTSVNGKLKTAASSPEQRDGIVDELVGLGYSRDWINKKLGGMPTESKTDTPEEDSGTKSHFFKSDLNNALEAGDFDTFRNVYGDLLDTAKKNGKTEKDFKTSVKSTVTSYWRPLYREASGLDKDGKRVGKQDESRMREIRQLLYQTGLYEDVSKTCQGWLK